MELASDWAISAWHYSSTQQNLSRTCQCAACVMGRHNTLELWPQFASMQDKAVQFGEKLLGAP